MDIAQRIVPTFDSLEKDSCDQNNDPREKDKNAGITHLSPNDVTFHSWLWPSIIMVIEMTRAASV